MNTDFSNDQQWTIRNIPWLIIFMTILLTGSLIAFVAPSVDFWAVVSVGVFLLVPLLFFCEIGTCRLDTLQRTIIVRRARILRSTQQEFAFGDVHTVLVEDSSDSEGSTYRVAFMLKSGETIPLSRYFSSGKRDKERLVEKIAAYINQTGGTPVNVALDGVTRIQQDGVTQGIGWQIFFVTAQGDSWVTRWQTSRASFSGGFLLIIPTGKGWRGGRMPGGILGTVARFFYRLYLKQFDLSEQDLSGFEGAEMLRGDQIGLDSRLALVTSSADAAMSWLTPARIHQLNAWQQSNPLGGNMASAQFHLVVTSEHLKIVFQGNFNRQDQIDSIARFGAGLAQ